MAEGGKSLVLVLGLVLLQQGVNVVISTQAARSSHPRLTLSHKGR